MSNKGLNLNDLGLRLDKRVSNEYPEQYRWIKQNILNDNTYENKIRVKLRSYLAPNDYFSFYCKPNQNILDQAERAGAPKEFTPFSNRNCSDTASAARVISGTVNPIKQCILYDAQVQGNWILLENAKALTDCELFLDEPSLYSLP